MNVLSLFDGISCGRIALERAGIQVTNYYASEIDPHATTISEKNYPNIIRLGDIENWKEWDLPQFDLIIGGSPCQGFSLAGAQKGFEDPRSKLFYHFSDIIKTLKPKHFLLENVKMKQESLDVITEHLSVSPTLVNSDLFVQQNRERYYWTNIPILPLPKRPNWQGSYFSWRRTYWRENKSGVSPCLLANMGTGGNNVPYVLENGEKRVLTLNELESLQGLPKDYTNHTSATQRKKAIGNGWTVDVIAHIFKGLLV